MIPVLIVFFTVLVILVMVGIHLRMYPRLPPSMEEGFSSPRVAPNQPTCVQRSGDAQHLLSLFAACADQYRAPGEDAQDRIELKLILNKLTCLDADVTNNGVSGYNTFNLPYNTSHDAEPLTNFVGRCLNNGTRSRDLEIVIDKYERRGSTLIKQLCRRANKDPKEPLNRYQNVVQTTMRALTDNCLAQHGSLDRPFGPRDPGFSVPFTVDRLSPF